MKYYVKNNEVSPDVVRMDDGRLVFNPRPEDYVAAGYKEVEYDSSDATGSDVDADEADAVRQRAEQDKKTRYESLVNTLIRRKYSLSDELAVLRQRSAKSEEYQEYYDYCEECKAAAKEQAG